MGLFGDGRTVGPPSAGSVGHEHAQAHHRPEAREFLSWRANGGAKGPTAYRPTVGRLKGAGTHNRARPWQGRKQGAGTGKEQPKSRRAERRWDGQMANQTLAGIGIESSDGSEAAVMAMLGGGTDEAHTALSKNLAK